jgi:hypothetical protein
MEITYKEILDTNLTLGSFPVSSRLFSLGRQAEIIAEVCQDRINDDGRFASISCDLLAKWMGDISRDAQACLDLQMEKDKVKTQKTQ